MKTICLALNTSLTTTIVNMPLSRQQQKHKKSQNFAHKRVPNGQENDKISTLLPINLGHPFL
jgi:hypothetical protein